jgi:uncharacterized membrane protein YfcA
MTVLGLLGGDGSILAAPVLVYVLGFGAKEAVAASLLVVGVTSLFGAAEHWREGHARLRVALAFGPFTAARAYLGAQLASVLSGAGQLSLFAAADLLMMHRLIARGPRNAGEGMRLGSLKAKYRREYNELWAERQGQQELLYRQASAMPRGSIAVFAFLHRALATLQQAYLACTLLRCCPHSLGIGPHLVSTYMKRFLDGSNSFRPSSPPIWPEWNGG